jgi:tetratricopeptide (TPR) repeat protein
MIGITRLAAAVAAVAVVAGYGLPAQAQYQNAFSPAKLIHRADTSVAIAGTGKVVIQVEVFADGSHKVIRIIKSTNAADNAAALDIAKNSTYRPQHRGTTPVTGFYDFTIQFHGRSVAGKGTPIASGAVAQIQQLIHAGKYDQAKAAAQQALAAKPNDPTLNQQLATADYFLKDYPGAAAAFDKVPSVSKPFLQVAAQSYALAASAELKQSNPSAALAFANKSVILAPSAGTFYVLGSAEFENGDTASAVQDLQKARSMAMADPKTDLNSKVNIDAALMQAYLKANDTASMQSIKDEIMRLDPTNTTVKRMIGNQYLAAGNAASSAGKHQEAVNDFLEATKQGDKDVAVTGYASAALEENTLIGAQKTPAVPNDYLTKMKPYADQALALNPNDALANYAFGVAMAGAWIIGGKQKADFKNQALNALHKAKAEAQAQGNIGLALNIDNFIKQNIEK